MRKFNVKRHKVVQPKYYRLVPLTQGQNAEVSVKDYNRVSQINWCARWDGSIKSFYAVASIKGEFVLMHRFIMGVGKGQQVDHRKPSDTLNNRRSNLRKATNSQNCCNQRKRKDNTSGYKGVTKVGKKWQAQIQKNSKSIYLGVFDTPELANKVVQKARKSLHGEFARAA